MQFSNIFHFTPANTSEMEVLSQLAHEIWPSTFAEILSTEQIQYMLEWMYNPEKLRKQIVEGHEFYFLRFEDKAIGFVGLQKNHPERGMLRIHKIYLLPSFQGQNLGKRMLNEIEILAKTDGLQILHLNVNRFNRAKDFYLKMGFQLDKEEKIDIGNGYFMDDFVMIKKLS